MVFVDQLSKMQSRMEKNGERTWRDRQRVSSIMTHMKNELTVITDCWLFL